jgi:hypothetical protein
MNFVYHLLTEHFLYRIYINNLVCYFLFNLLFGKLVGQYLHRKRRDNVKLSISFLLNLLLSKSSLNESLNS